METLAIQTRLPCHVSSSNNRPFPLPHSGRKVGLVSRSMNILLRIAADAIIIRKKKEENSCKIRPLIILTEKRTKIRDQATRQTHSRALSLHLLPERHKLAEMLLVRLTLGVPAPSNIVILLDRLEVIQTIILVQS